MAINHYYFYALVLHSQGLKISKSKNVCPEWLQWRCENCELARPCIPADLFCRSIYFTFIAVVRTAHEQAVKPTN